MRITIMDYDPIRPQYLLENKSQRQITKELGISRNTVDKYCKEGAYPSLRASYKRTRSVVTPEVVAFITGYQAKDAAERKKKQHQTAQRIYDAWLQSLPSQAQKARCAMWFISCAVINVFDLPAPCNVAHVHLKNVHEHFEICSFKQRRQTLNSTLKRTKNASQFFKRNEVHRGNGFPHFSG